MNHDSDHIPAFDDPDHEREWLAQESAMRRERLHLDSAGDDVSAQRYRLLSRALRVPSADTLPADFAQRMSAMVSMPHSARFPTVAFERTLTSALAGVLLLAAVTVTVLYGASWWPSFKLLLPAPAAAQWLLALLGCLGLNGVLGVWSRRASPDM